MTSYDAWPAPVLPTDPVTLRELSRHERGLLGRFGQLFRYDLSEAYVLPPNPDGSFTDRETDLFFARADDRRAFVIEAAGRPAGYAITSRHDGVRRMSSFWVARAYRRTGVGRRAAALVVATHPGRWRIGFQDYNPGAPEFWAAVATDLVGDAWTRTYQDPHPPERPPDTWISFEVGA